MSSLVEQLERVEREMPRILKTGMQRFPVLMQGFIGQQMNFSPRQSESLVAPSRSSRLAINSGALYRSFGQNGKGGIFTVDVTANAATVRYGTALQYARIHEEGGFIATKGKMHKYFWAMYYKTGSPYYKSLALAVIKNGGVRIPKRPFLEPAQVQFEAKGLPVLMNDIMKELSRVFNG